VAAFEWARIFIEFKKNYEKEKIMQEKNREANVFS
jgi:hypothetical protein